MKDFGKQERQAIREKEEDFDQTRTRRRRRMTFVKMNLVHTILNIQAFKCILQTPVTLK